MSGLAHIFNNNIIIILKYKKIKSLLKIFVIFLYVFLIILHNIGLYIYIVRYISDIKIPDFLQNISKKNKKFKNKSKKFNVN
jgi:hypothetical protein